ncbi:MAG: alpha/beta hydrolase [Chitinophagaceae bacterium]|nr:alpha/beta hydrolase [Chitinophagaceae bacterium]
MIRILSVFIILCSTTISFAQQMQTVIINGVDIQYKSYGKGNITVVFEAGMGEGMDNWGTIPESVSKFAKVLCYNRPGINGAPQTKELATVPVMANRLYQLIQQMCSANDSIILVAHSMGGYMARYVANKHPKNIMALVLIDPSAEGVYENMTQKELEAYIKAGNEKFASQPPGVQEEWKHYLTNYPFMSGINTGKKIQVYIFSSSELNFYKYQHKQMNKNLWSQHFLVEGSPSFYLKQPKLIVDLLDQVVEKLNYKP